MKFFLAMALAIASAACMGQTTIPENGKALNGKPEASETALAKIPSKTGDGETLTLPLDYQFVWDEFKHRGKLVWACRNSNTGQFVASSKCVSQPMVDSRWPDKDTPQGYSGVLNFD